MPETIADAHELFVFDLDGTLVDSLEDLARSLNAALAGAGRPRLPLSTVREYVGSGARRLIERSLGGAADPALVGSVLEAFLEHYREHCLRSTRLYPGVRESLRALAPKPLALLTNKPLEMSRKILEGLGVLGAFRDVLGGDSLEGPDGDPLKKPRPDGLLEICRRAGVPKAKSLLVGDTGVDVATARAAGTRVAGVTYGFRPEEFRESPPDYLLDSIAELLEPPGHDVAAPAGPGGAPGSPG